MSGAFGNIATVGCVTDPPPADTRCDDPAFRIQHPDACPSTPRFILKPGLALVCALGAIQFKAFRVENGIESDVTADTTFTSSDSTIVAISATTGAATGVAPGTAIITGTSGDAIATAELTVLAGENCCDDLSVAFMVLVDCTKSMKQGFGGAYSKKLDYAKAAAKSFIEGVNASKDTVGLMSFTKDDQTILSLPTDDTATVSDLVDSITQTEADTSFYDALESAIAALDATSADRKAIFIISEGEDTTPDYSEFNPISLTDTFKGNGGLVICLGVRSHGPGYELLAALATGGFLVNAYPAFGSISSTASAALDYVAGLRGYICAGNCTPSGDSVVGTGALSYSDFTKWDVTNGAPDLVGQGFFDVLPGNGLYVDLASSATVPVSGNPVMTTKDSFAVTGGHTYSIILSLAGNQVLDQAESVFVQAVSDTFGAVGGKMLVADYSSGFAFYVFSWTPANDDTVKIKVWQTGAGDWSEPAAGSPQAGVLLGSVELRDSTTGTQRIFFDDFDDENLQYVEPDCGPGSYYHVTGMATTLTIADAGTVAANGVYTKTNDTLYELESSTNYIQFDSGSGLWQLFVPDLDPVNAYYESEDLLAWTVASGSGPAPTGELGGEPVYGYGYGYNCYGDGCLDNPPPPQLPDPNPLINLETGYTPAGQHTATQQVCYKCPPGFVNAGVTLDATTLTAGDDNETQVRLATATAIVRWQLEFLRSWARTEDDAVLLAIEGSSDGATWVSVGATSVPADTMLAGNILTTELAAASTAYRYYRAVLTGGDATDGSDKILSLEVQGVPTETVCRSATATGATRQAAIQAAQAAALAAAQDAANCVPEIVATATFTAQCEAPCIGSYTATATARGETFDAAYAAALAEATDIANDALECDGSTNEQAITLDGGFDPERGDPYPSVQSVTGVTGAVTKVTVTIKKFYHDQPNTVRMLLQAPDGTLVELMQGAGGATPITEGNAVTFTFESDSVTPVPDPIVEGGAYAPTVTSGSSLPEFAPASPYSTDMTDLHGMDPNGCWALWVDTALGATDGGKIKLGWTIEFETA